MTDKTRRKSILPESAKKAKEAETEQNQKSQAETKEDAKETTGTGKKKVKFKTSTKNKNETNATTTATDLEKLKKRKSFNQTHTRITTYLENEVNNKVKKLKTEMNIPVKELINTSLKVFFIKHNL